MNMIDSRQEVENQVALILWVQFISSIAIDMKHTNEWQTKLNV